MSSRNEKDRQKQIQDKCQNLLTQMLRDEDNKYCVDCDAKGPRWASWNLGIFLCIRCAGIHRNLGVHISKVKSVNLDTWTPEQVVSLQQMGNSRARAVYEANLPDSFRRPQTDSALESFIRAKYESKKYIAQEWVPPSLPKVNWDKELDEEAERTRKKKREIKTTTPIPVPKQIEVIPQAIPKPHSSPKNRDSSRRESRNNSGGAGDLLGLDTPTSETPQQPEDVFTTFFSATPQSAVPTAATASDPVPGSKRSEEEESFFNQSLSSVAGNAATSGSGKLTTDSILALYSKAPPIPAVTGFGPVPPAMPPYSYGVQPQPQPNVLHVFPRGDALPGSLAGGSNPFYSMQQAGKQPQQQLLHQGQQIDFTQQLSGLNINANPLPQNPQFQSAAPMTNHLWQ